MGAEPQTLRTERLEGAQRERIWAVVEAHQSGPSVRQIASATGLSSSRDPAPRLGRGPRDPLVATVNSAGGTALTAQVSPTFRLTSRASWRLSASAASGWNAWIAESGSL